MVEVDLARLTQHKVSMLTGHPRGLSARELYHLDDYDRSGETVVIVAPKELDTITPSFVQGFLAASLSRLGEAGLRQKYEFDRLPEVLRQDFETGIQRLLLHSREDAIAH